MAVGDGESGPDWTDAPQDLGRPQGKLLRIDPEGSDGPDGRYGIPADNPFVGDAGALGEVFALGMRNPHRFSWDAEDGGRLLMGVIGEANIDAIYDVRSGDNLGWNEREGRFRFERADPTNLYPLPEDDERYGYTYPVASYDHDTGFAVVGGFVYRGDALPALDGLYVFGDVVNGRIFSTVASQMRRGATEAPISELRVADRAGNPVTMRDLAGNDRVDFRLGRDTDGELYVLSKANGRIWRIRAAMQSQARL